jgi:hypothetical protein
MADARKICDGGHIIPEESPSTLRRANHMRTDAPGGLDLEFDGLRQQSQFTPRTETPSYAACSRVPPTSLDGPRRQSELFLRYDGLGHSESSTPDCVIVWVESQLASRN